VINCFDGFDRNSTTVFAEHALNYEPFPMDDVFFGGLNAEMSLPAHHLPMRDYFDCKFMFNRHQLPVFHHLALCHQADFGDQQALLWQECCHSPTLTDDRFGTRRKIRRDYCQYK